MENNRYSMFEKEWLNNKSYCSKFEKGRLKDKSNYSKSNYIFVVVVTIAARLHYMKETSNLHIMSRVGL